MTIHNPGQLAPIVPGLPYIGSGLKLTKDPALFLRSLYRQYGPVFRMRLLGKEVTVLAGVEANQFFARNDELFGSDKLFGTFGIEMGSDAMLVALDGVPHRHQRKLQQRGYSRGTFLNAIETVVGMTQTAARSWPVGTPIPLFRAMQILITDQLGAILMGRPTGDLFDDLLVVFRTALGALVTETSPRLLLKLPRYQRARRRIMAFAQDLLDSHRTGSPAQRSILIDDLISAVDETGQPYSDGAIIAAIIGAYFAGMDTVAATLSFMLAAILQTPGVAERITAEADAAFASGGLTGDSLRGMETLHHAAMETLRLYPVAPFTPRTATQTFTFAGVTIPAGSDLYIANGLPHYLEECYPNPDAFDVDRYTRADYHKTPQAFAPYTLGAHTCLGAGMAETQLMAVTAILLHTLRLELVDPSQRLIVYASPIPNPGSKLAVKVAAQR